MTRRPGFVVRQDGNDIVILTDPWDLTLGNMVGIQYIEPLQINYFHLAGLKRYLLTYILLNAIFTSCITGQKSSTTIDFPV